MIRKKRFKNIVSMIILSICFSIMTPVLPGEETQISAGERVSAAAVPLDTVLNETARYVIKVDPTPGMHSQWTMIGLIRMGYPVSQTYIDTFYSNVVSELDKKKGILSKSKYSDYSKLVLSMTSIGKDASDIAGYDILSKLSDFDKVKYQGFNGPIWALIALNSHPSYSIPLNDSVTNQTTEEGMINYLVRQELDGGGWSLMGTEPDVDITAMTIQALAPYYKKEGYEAVTESLDRAVSWLSKVQGADGGYYTLSGNGHIDNSESTSQALTALSALGIDGHNDSRFIKNGNSIVTALLTYRKDGGFMHVKPGGASNGGAAIGAVDGMATEQAFYALTAYKRYLSGKSFLYDMSDISLSTGDKPDPSPSTGTTEKKETTTASAKIKVTGVSLNYSQISLAVAKTRSLTAYVKPSGATNKKLSWSSSNTGIATVTSKGKVKGIRAGTAVITAKAKDGSGKKASCKVVVYSTSTSSTSGTTAARRATTPAQTYGQASTGANTSTPAAGTSGNPTGSAGGSQEETTQASAWSFNGASYVPDSTETAEAVDLSDPAQEETDGFVTEDEVGMTSDGDMDVPDSAPVGTLQLPLWLSVLIGLCLPALALGGKKVGWSKIASRLPGLR